MTEALRPLTIGELLDRSFSLYRRHFQTLVGIAAISSLLTLAFALTVILMDLQSGNWLPRIGASLGGAAIYLLAAAFAQGGITIAVSKFQLGQQTSASEAMSAIRPQVGSLALTIFNSGLRTAIGFLFLIVPGVILMAKYALAVPVAVLEQRVGSDALSRSGDLTSGHRGRILLIYLLLFLLMLIGNLLWQIPTFAVIYLSAGLEGLQQASVPVRVMVQLGSYLTEALLAPIVYVAFALVYFDQRVRKEAFDLERMMQEIDGTPAGSPSHL